VARGLHQMQLVLAEAEPAHRATEVGRGYALEAECLAVEALRLVEVAAGNADVVDALCFHGVLTLPCQPGVVRESSVMIPAGYTAKRASPRPEWLAAEQVVDIYSVSGCISAAFADYIPYWKHNGYWLFDAPEVIRQLARENAIDLEGTTLFYYEVYEQEFDE